MIIWWHGWEHAVPVYGDPFDLDEYLERMIEMEELQSYECEEEDDNHSINNDHIVIVNPNGNISLGKHVKNSN